MRRPIRHAMVPTGIVLFVLLEAWSAWSAGITGPSKGDPAAGKKIFKDKCVACHKPDGSGGVKVTGNPTPDFRDPKRMSDPKYNDDYLRDCITNGKVKSGMVPWSKQGVKPAQIENLIAYIRTFSAEKKAAEGEKSPEKKAAAEGEKAPEQKAGGEKAPN